MLDATPCKFMDLPQWYLEPILIRQASNKGIIYRFNTELVDFARDKHGILSVVKDLNFGTTYEIRSKYIFGADGGRSFVARKGNFEFDMKPSLGIACNILFEANLEGRMDGREAQLQIVSKPDRKSRFGIGPIVRQIRPWHEWMLVVFTPGATEDPFQDLTPQSQELISYIKECFGDDSINVTVKRIDPWTVRENVAHQFSQSGDTFLVRNPAIHTTTGINLTLCSWETQPTGILQHWGTYLCVYPELANREKTRRQHLHTGCVQPRMEDSLRL